MNRLNNKINRQQQIVSNPICVPRDYEQEAEGGMTGSASVEAEDELVEIALQVLAAQAVINAACPPLEVREQLMDPRQHDVGGH